MEFPQELILFLEQLHHPPLEGGFSTEFFPQSIQPPTGTTASAEIVASARVLASPVVLRVGLR
jgi:hypothetical protein